MRVRSCQRTSQPMTWLSMKVVDERSTTSFVQWATTRSI